MAINIFTHIRRNLYDNVYNCIVKDKININERDEDTGNPPLIVAVSENNKEIVELLLTNGANIHIKDYEYGDTILLSMMLGKCKDVNVDIINMLLLYGANINDKSKDGETIFDSAVFRIRDIKFMIKISTYLRGKI